jgi:predicted HTH transcriptional regulator
MDLLDSYTAAEFAEVVEIESDVVELKTGLGGVPIQEALVAFSNAGGGIIFVGVQRWDRSREAARSVVPGSNP